MKTITTYSGRRFPLYPCDPEQIRLCDLAHQLAAENRFSGATRQPYNVAQHSTGVMEVACKLAIDAGMEDEDVFLMGAIALFHDAGEAYPPGDIAKPAKDAAEDRGEAGHLITIQNEIQAAIYRRYNLPVSMPAGVPELPWPVKMADEIMLRAESRDLMHNGSDIPPSWTNPDTPLEGFDGRAIYAAGIVVKEIRVWGPEEAELRWLLMAADALHLLWSTPERVEEEIAEAINLLLPETPPPLGKGYASPADLKLRLTMGHMKRSKNDA